MGKFFINIKIEFVAITTDFRIDSVPDMKTKMSKIIYQCDKLEINK